MTKDVTEIDDNAEILKIIKSRMEVGLKTYGHGLRVDDDTRQFGTKTNSWTEMVLEEVLDNLLYIAAQLIRVMRNESGEVEKTDSDPKKH